MSEPVPFWLAAWRNGAAQPLNEREQPVAPARAPAVAAAPAQTAQALERKAHPMSKGFTEPDPWPFDGCVRRGNVLDHDHNPPRVVRRVGWQRCIRCREPFWSADVVRLRLCSAGLGCRERY